MHSPCTLVRRYASMQMVGAGASFISNVGASIGGATMEGLTALSVYLLWAVVTTLVFSLLFVVQVSRFNTHDNKKHKTCMQEKHIDPFIKKKNRKTTPSSWSTASTSGTRATALPSTRSSLHPCRSWTSCSPAWYPSTTPSYGWPSSSSTTSSSTLSSTTCPACSGSASPPPT